LAQHSCSEEQQSFPQTSGGGQIVVVTGMLVLVVVSGTFEVVVEVSGDPYYEINLTVRPSSTKL
jgi:hypothetical protein